MEKMRLTNRMRKAFQGRSRGFTLIEVLIALALFAIIAIVFAGGLATASRAVLIADVRTRAESLARTQMESVKNEGYNDTLVAGQVTYPQIPSIPAGYSIWSYNRTDGIVPSVIGVPWDSSTGQPYQPSSEDNGLQRIKLVIKHDGTAVLTMEGYKRNPET